MKKLFLVSLLVPISFFLVVSGCSKSNSGTGNPQESANMLLVTKAAWKLDTSGIDANGDGTVDIAGETVADCDKDNTYLFNKDSTGVIDAGATKCNDSDPQTSAFTWSFNTDQTIIKSDFDPLLVNGVNIFSLTDSKLIVYKDSVISGFTVRYLISLKH